MRARCLRCAAIGVPLLATAGQHEGGPEGGELLEMLQPVADGVLKTGPISASARTAA